MDFFHGFSSSFLKQNLSNLFKETWVLLFMDWTPAFMLNIESFTDDLLVFTKLSKGRSFSCI